MSIRVLIGVDSPTPQQADLINQLLASGAVGVSPSPSPAPAPAPSPSPAPVDLNVYPLTMTPVANPGDPVTIGVGPNYINLLFAGLGTTFPEFSVEIDGKMIAVNLQVTSNSGMVGGQFFTINGSWGPGPHNITFQPAGAVGLAGLWMNRVAYDGIDCYFNGPTMDARGAPVPPNSTTAWDNIGSPCTWTTEPVAVVLPPPTIENGGTAPAVSDGKLQALVTATTVGGICKVPAETVKGGALVPVQMTIAGTGMGQTIVDMTGVAVPFNKAGIVLQVDGCTVQDLTVTGAAITDADGANGCGVRQNADGIAMMLTRVEIFGCQEGILSQAGAVTLDTCNIHDNSLTAQASGLTHNLYFNGTPTMTHTVRHSTIAHAQQGHELKCRAGNLAVTDTAITSGPGGASGIGGNGSCIDMPDGGKITIVGGSFTKEAGSSDHQIITIAMESKNNGASAIAISGSAFTSGLVGAPALITSGDPAATIAFTNCTGTIPNCVGFAAKTVDGVAVAMP